MKSLNYSIHFFILSLLWLSIICLSKTIIILGESGNGKSTIITKVFEVIEHVQVGGDYEYDSVTKRVFPYHSSEKSSLFAGYTIYDSPGFHDTAGLTNEEILELIDVELSQINSNETTMNDGMILMIGTMNEKDRSTLHIKDYVSLFGEDMLTNLMIVVNRYDSKLSYEEAFTKATTLKIHLEYTLADIVSNSKNYTQSGLKIPIVTIDCKHPKQEEMQTLKNALLKLKPYPLRQINQEKRARIQEIFDAEIANMSNYKNHTEKIIDYEMQNLTEEVIVTKHESMAKKVCTGNPSWRFNLGVISGSGGPSCSWGSEIVRQDYVKEIKKETKVAFTADNITQVLRNEETYYWEFAKHKYQQELLEQFKRGKQKQQ